MVGVFLIKAASTPHSDWQEYQEGLMKNQTVSR
jgi:hypothetical protein